MRIVVGLDLRRGSAGALRFVQWLASTGAASPNDMVGAHAVEGEHLWRSIPPMGPGTVVDALVPLARRDLVSAGLSAVRCEVSEAPTAESLLCEVAERHDADLIVLGRRASAGRIVRLGRVARRLLRMVPTAVCVVPPDWRSGKTGPVVLATDMGESTAGAAKFAPRMAEALCTGLTVAHVIPTRADPHTAYERAGVKARPADELAAECEPVLERWIADEGLRGATPAMPRGDRANALLELTDQVGAQALVVGTRRLSTSRRIFTASLASTIAGLADCPVVCVPPSAADFAAEPGDPLLDSPG